MSKFRILTAFFILLAFTSCTWKPCHEEYECFYSHLDDKYNCGVDEFTESDYYIVFLTNARHLDYSDTQSMMKTLAKHPSDGSKNGDVGHAWVYLKGKDGYEDVVIEGGHSGELGVIQAKYFEGVINNVQYGYPNPTLEQIDNPRYEPNPIKYLLSIQPDGYFQEGSGNHLPTYAAKFDLTEEEFEMVLEYINPRNYNYKDYALTFNQCSTLVAGVADLLGIHLDYEVTLEVDEDIKVGLDTVHLRTDPEYAQICIASPDVIERSLIEAVNDGRAENATEWYLGQNQAPFSQKLSQAMRNAGKFPKRAIRAMHFW
jgi:hypothetical protein